MKTTEVMFPTLGSLMNGLMNGQYADRVTKGNKLLAQLLPQARKTQLEQSGIRVMTCHVPSRRNPRFVFSFIRKDREYRVICEVGARRLWMNKVMKRMEPLLPLEQLSQKIDEAICSLRSCCFYD